MDKIFSGFDRAQELGFISYRDFIEHLAGAFRHKPDWTAVDQNKPLNAIVRDGRWLVECDCGEFYYVHWADPLGFCPTCGNVTSDGRVRPIIFPTDRAAIEAALLERQMEGDPGTIRKLGSQAPLFSRLAHPKFMPRHWDGETADELRAQHKKVKEITAELKKLNPQGLPHWQFSVEQLEQIRAELKR